MSTPYDEYGGDVVDERYDSFLDDMGYGEDTVPGAGAQFQSEEKPRILLMGLRRSGKSSIQKVVFHKVSPNETLFLESTTKVIKDDISNSSFVQFQVWDFPGQLDFFDPTFDSNVIFGGCGALIFVIDVQEDYSEALVKLLQTIMSACKVNPHITFAVFIHKADGLSEEHKTDCHRDIYQQVTGELTDSKLDVHISFHLTSIYDHTIFEAFSRVVQKLIPQHYVVERLLDILAQDCRIDKAFLFDVVSKIYVATDSSPVDMQTYELCSDMIDVAIDVSCIFGNADDEEGRPRQDTHHGSLAYDPQSASVIRLDNSSVLYMKEINKYLAIVCLLRSEHFVHQGLIDYNITCFKRSIEKTFKVGGNANRMAAAEREEG